MRYLREHGDEIAEGKKKQLERSARRREYLGSKVAAAGGSSWDALKSAAQKAAEAKRNHDDRKAEEQAWRENERRGDVDVADAEPTDTGGEDATVLSFSRRRRDDGSTEVEVDTGGTSNITGDPNDPLTWRGTDSRGRDIQTGRGPRRMETAPDGSEGVVHDTDTYRLRTDETPERRIVLDAQRRQQEAEAAESATGSGEEESAAQNGEDALTNTTTDPEKDYLLDPDKPGMNRISVADLHRRRAREDEDRRQAAEAAQRAHEAEQAQAEREHRERLAQIQMQQNSPPAEDGATNTTTASCGGLTVTTHSGEITDLTSAINYVTAASDYCDAIAGTFETTQAQANATAEEMEGQLGGLETAQSSLRGFEMNSQADRLSQVAERYSELVQAMQQVETALTTAREAISAAKSELDDSASEFQSQTGIAEQLNREEDVASDTRFYTYA